MTRHVVGDRKAVFVGDPETLVRARR